MYNLGTQKTVRRNLISANRNVLFRPDLSLHQHLGHAHLGIARARERLDGENLEVEVATVEAILVPVVEVVASGDCARRALLFAN